MFLICSNGILDYDLDFIEELLVLIDGQIDRLAAEAKTSSDPDSFGIYDRGEAIVGLGFVACQQYINATYPDLGMKDKLTALRVGPKHANGFVAESINAAANYWKHRDERQVKGGKQEERTITATESNEPQPRSDYPLSDMLREVVGEQSCRFRSVVPLLINWRDQLIMQHRPSQRVGDQRAK